MISQELKKKFTTNPKELFIIDGLGAIISAIMLGVVLVYFQSIFGIPKTTLYFLAVLPIGFAILDFYWWSRVRINYARSLKLIAFINISYCILSVGLTLFHFDSVTLLGWTYIFIEVIIVLYIAMLELKVSASLLDRNAL